MLILPTSNINLMLRTINLLVTSLILTNDLTWLNFVLSLNVKREQLFFVEKNGSDGDDFL